MAWLEEPRLRGAVPGTPGFFEIQRQIIVERPLLRGIYEQWHRALLEDEASVPGRPDEGALVELGSGGSLLRQSCPRVITSDLVEGVADRVIDGSLRPT